MKTETEIPQGEFADESSPEQVAQPDDPQEYGEFQSTPGIAAG